MKRKDLIVIGVTVFVAGLVSYFICSKFLFSGSSHNQTVEVVEAITSDFSLPDKTIFNSDAIDPTQLIQIGPNSNDQPFTASTQ